MSIHLNQLNALDPSSFGSLHRIARESHSPESLRIAAKQFEGLLIQMMLKAMREATPQNSLFDNEQTRMLQSFHDQQLAMQMAQSTSGIGLADVLFRQLGGQQFSMDREPEAGQDGTSGHELSLVPRRPAVSSMATINEANFNDAESSSEANPTHEGQNPSSVERTPASVSERVAGFVDRLWSHAVETGKSIGIPPKFMLAQAALETGWGRAELRTTDGKQSFNIFNIKAGRNWNGPVVELPVTEYADGRPYTERARFRVYGSYAEAFHDFASLMLSNPRYKNVLGQTDPVGFAQSLQKAGYATDPLYADKLARIINGPSLRAALEN